MDKYNGYKDSSTEGATPFERGATVQIMKLALIFFTFIIYSVLCLGALGSIDIPLQLVRKFWIWLLIKLNLNNFAKVICVSLTGKKNKINQT